MGGACGMYGTVEKCIKYFHQKTWRKRPLRRPRHRWEYNIRMDLNEIGWKLWTGFIWLRIGTNGKLLWTQ